MRLLGLYGSEAVNICYPGSRPMMDMEFPGDKEPIAIKRTERKLVADIQRSEPEQTELPILAPAAKAKRTQQAEV
jgi:hypothetical protein